MGRGAGCARTCIKLSLVCVFPGGGSVIPLTHVPSSCVIRVPASEPPRAPSVFLIVVEIKRGRGTEGLLLGFRTLR